MAKPSWNWEDQTYLICSLTIFWWGKKSLIFWTNIFGETLISAFYSKFAFSVQFSASYLQAQSCIAAVCFVKILSFFHLPENRGLAANTIAIGFTPGTCCYVLYKFCNSCTCTSLKILVFESLQWVPKKSI